jgi:hypothetical protein
MKASSIELRAMASGFGLCATLLATASLAQAPSGPASLPPSTTIPHSITVNGQPLDLQAALEEARKNQTSSNPQTALSGLLQEASCLNTLGDHERALALLRGRYPQQVSLGWQGEYLYTLGRIEYGHAPQQGMADMNKAIEMVGPGAFQMHLLMMRDARLGLWIPPQTTDSVDIPN